MITISAVVELCIGFDLHAIDAENLAGSLVSLPVDSDEAFEADTHAAERTAWIVGDGSAKCRDAESEDGGSDARPARNGAGGAVDRQSECFSHSVSW
jgi:hypothetical protein